VEQEEEDDDEKKAKVNCVFVEERVILSLLKGLLSSGEEDTIWTVLCT
jgi:hypothetical protein